jgi:hypothetical protein
LMGECRAEALCVVTSSSAYLAWVSDLCSEDGPTVDEGEGFWSECVRCSPC